MKKTIFFLFSVTTFASASVVTVSNIADEMTSAVLLDNTATPILSGDAFIHIGFFGDVASDCLLYTSPSPRDQRGSRMPSSA